MGKRRVRVHAYTADPEAPGDWRGDVPCSTCGAAKSNARHDLPETTQAARDRDNAVLGEKEEA